MGKMPREKSPEWFDRMRRCDGKEKLDQANAVSRAAGIRKRDRHSSCGAYKCNHCGAWHIGHQREVIK